MLDTSKERIEAEGVSPCAEQKGAVLRELSRLNQLKPLTLRQLQIVGHLQTATITPGAKVSN